MEFSCFKLKFFFAVPGVSIVRVGWKSIIGSSINTILIDYTKEISKCRAGFRVLPVTPNQILNVKICTFIFFGIPARSYSSPVEYHQYFTYPGYI